MNNTAEIANSNGSAVASQKPATLKGMLDSPGIKKRFEEIMGAKAPAFISSVLNVVNGNTNLSMADPQSVIMSAAVAATLDLPINPNLGFAYIIPYQTSKQNDQGQWVAQQIAQFQMGYKGFIQLAMRTGQYKTINVTEVRTGQLVKANPLTEEYQFDWEVEGKEVIGYVAYFKLLSGFEKTVYWNVGKVIDHAKRFSKSYGKKSSPWTTNFPEMAQKTLIKHVLSKYGVLSIEMQKAVNVDQAVIKDMTGEQTEYVDHTDLSEQRTIEATTTEVKDENLEQNFRNDSPTQSENPANNLDISGL